MSKKQAKQAIKATAAKTKQAVVAGRADNSGAAEAMIARLKQTGKPLSCPDMWRYLNGQGEVKPPKHFSFARRGQVRAILNRLIGAGTIQRVEQDTETSAGYTTFQAYALPSASHKTKAKKVAVKAKPKKK